MSAFFLGLSKKNKCPLRLICFFRYICSECSSIICLVSENSRHTVFHLILLKLYQVFLFLFHFVVSALLASVLGLNPKHPSVLFAVKV